MIPLHLSLSGFLSYCDPVEIDLTPIELACISGANGAGKSSLLDAITWALFGEARGKVDGLVNHQAAEARVGFTFLYEGVVYRVQRAKPRDKTGIVEFQALQPPDGMNALEAWRYQPRWSPLTERSTRETDARIQATLRMDYDTFVNASFFLQGRADQFTQQRPSDRKRILSSILGLDAWETYRERARARRATVEAEQKGLASQLGEIAAELDEEPARRQRLEQIEISLASYTGQRREQEKAVDSIRRLKAAFDQQAHLTDSLGRQAESAAADLASLDRLLDDRRKERDTFAGLLAHAAGIEAVFAAWQAARAELAEWDAAAERFRQHEKRRDAPRDEINAARAALQAEQVGLEREQTAAVAARAAAVELQAALDALRPHIDRLTARLSRREALAADLHAARQSAADARAENASLKREMDALKGRIDRLKTLADADCPFCGRPIAAHDRDQWVAELETEGKTMGDRHRLNKAAIERAEAYQTGLQNELDALSRAEVDLRRTEAEQANLQARLKMNLERCSGWEAGGALRLTEVAGLLESESFAAEARRRLGQIDEELRLIGYDAAAHDDARRSEQITRPAGDRMRALESARLAIEPLERTLAALETQRAGAAGQAAQHQADYVAATAALESARVGLPDLDEAEARLYDLQEQENRLRTDLGMARQNVAVLDDLKERRRRLEARKEELHADRSHLLQLEKAFGKDGVPALLIEQALPEIEARSNALLERLSNGAMTVKFVTQAAYKDKKRDDLKETLDIQISDGAGQRDYENYSGGEQFRVNFAVRLALSQVLAQRAGARLQTLVIDEGFGSQDAEGRQRLIEAINQVHPDFARILVITHIEELKDAFPNRIEVEKTPRGSTLRVL
jgi:exonuclease SbcC